MDTSATFRWRALREVGETGEVPPWHVEPLDDGANLVDGPSRLADLARSGVPILAHARRPGELSQCYVIRHGRIARVPRPINLHTDILPCGLGNDWVTLSEAETCVLVRGYFLCATAVLPVAVGVGAIAKRLNRNVENPAPNDVFAILAQWADDPGAHVERVERALALVRGGLLARTRDPEDTEDSRDRFNAARDMALFLLIRTRLASCETGYWDYIALAATRMGLPATWLSTALPVDTVATILTA